ncbi:MAG: DUF4157 domain-containing protein [Myxococcales bacterium]|nr:DUF4157 domain-containing protein [Myxococcales bacterium]
MANKQDEELLQLQAQGSDLAVDQGAKPGALAAQLAAMQSSSMGQTLAQRYAGIGAKWLSDAAPTRLDTALIDRLSNMGFRRESLADVRIHRGPKAQQAADALTARAFALGDGDVFFGRGEFDPHTTGGLAVLAHELAHVAPPTSMPGGVAPSYGGGLPSSFGGGPILNERRSGNEDAAQEEAQERLAREAEQRVFATEEGGSAPSVSSAPSTTIPTKSEGDARQEKRIDAVRLEAKVMEILAKWDRIDVERGGTFVAH